jgi:SAM-dependent methyltransferase
MATVDYGLDSPKDLSTYLWRGGTFLAFGFGVYWMNRVEYPGPGLRVMAVFALAGLVFLALAAWMYWSSKTGKLKLRDEILEKVAIGPEEQVLDVGCGRGLLLIAAAKKLAKGKATGVDIWHPDDLSGNKAEATLANANAEGVGNRVRIESGDALSLPYKDEVFDVVMSSGMLHHIPEATHRADAVKEMWRVAKPGARLAIYDLWHAADHAATLTTLGIEDLELSGHRFLWGQPGRLIFGRKPAAK